ncbi:oligosaccharide flippase family protein [Pyruvatibacter sp.]
MKTIALTLLATAVMQLANIGFSAFMARNLGAAGRGDFAAIVLWVGLFAAFGSLGIAEAITYVSASKSATKRAIYGTFLYLAATLSVCVVPISLFILQFVIFPDNADILYLSILYLFHIPLTYISVFQLGLVRGGGKSDAWNILRVAMPVLQFFLAVILVLGLGDPTLEAFIFSSLFADLLLGLCAFLYCRRIGWVGVHFKKAAAAKILDYGLRLHPGFVGRQAGEWVDRATISLLLSSEILGLYVVAISLARGLPIMGQSIAAIIVPQIASATEEVESKQVVERLMRVNFLLTLLVGLLVLLLSPWLLPGIFGPGFSGAVPICIGLSISYFFLSISTTASACLNGFGRPEVTSKIDLTGVFFTAALLIPLCILFGVTGVVVALIIGRGMVCATYILFLARSGILNVRAIWIPTATDLRMAVQRLSSLRRA